MPAYEVITDKVPFGKQHYRRGAVIDVEASEVKHAELLRKIGKLKIHEGEVKSATDLPEAVMARAARSEPLTEVEAKPAPLYRTRHMEAEKPASAPRAKRGRPAGKAKK